MNKVKNEIAVGILFFAALGILGYFTIISSNDFFSKREYYKIRVIFDSIEGLGQADRVKVNGVEAGNVESTQLLDDNNVLVELKMYKKFVMYENYLIKIQNVTALGGKYIGIDPGSGQANGNKYAIMDFNNILSGKRSGDLLGELTDMITENRPDIRKSVRNFEEITAKINSGQGTFGKLLNENKVYDNTDDLVTEVRQTLEDTREQAPITSFIKAALGFL